MSRSSRLLLLRLAAFSVALICLAYVLWGRNAQWPTAILVAGVASLTALILLQQVITSREYAALLREEQQRRQADAALAESRLTLYQTVQRQLEELRILHAVASAGTEAATEDELIERATAIIGETLYPDNFGVMLLAPDQPVLVAHASYHHWGLAQPEWDRHIPLGQGITGHVGVTGVSWRIDDVRQEPVYLELVAETRSEVCVPMKTGERVIGVINAESTRLAAFTEADERLLMTLAGQLATALEKFRLLAAERAQRELAEILRQVGAVLVATLNFEQVLDLLLELLAQVVPYDAANVMLVEGETARLTRARGYAQYGATIKQGVTELRLSISNTANLRHMAATRQPHSVNDTAADSGWVGVAATPYFHAWAGAPIIVQPDGLIGFFSLDKVEAHFYRPDHLTRLGAFTAQAALALQNARLFSRAQHREAELSTLLDVARAVSSSLEPEDVLRHIATSMCRALDMERCGLSTYELEARRLRTRAVYYLRGDLDTNRRFDSTFALDDYPLSARAIDQGEIITVRADDPHADPAEVALLHEYGDTTLLMFALRAAGRVEGLAELYTCAARAFTADDLRLARGLAGQVGVALANARLYQAEREQRELAEVLRDIGIAISASLDVETVLDHLLDQVARVVPYDSGVVMLVTEGRARPARWRGYSGSTAAIRQALETLLFDVAHVPTFRRMAQTGAPCFIPDTPADPDWMEAEVSHEVRSWVGAPVFIQGEIAAIFSLDKHQPNYYNAEHARRLGAFAGQAALALHNAQLFQSQTQHVTELEAVRQASLSLTANLELKPLLETILQNTVRLAPQAQDAHIFLYDPGTDTLTFGAALFPHGNPEGVTYYAPRPGGLTYTVAQQGQMVVISNMAEHPIFSNAPATWRGAILGMPLHIGQRVVGVMNVAFPLPRDFPESELRVLRLLGDQAAIAIENARLLAESQRQADEVTLVSRILHTLNAIGEVSAAFARIAPEVYALGHCDGASLALLDESRTRAAIYSLKHYHPELPPRMTIAVEHTAASANVLAGQLHLTSNLETEAAQFEVEREMLALGYRSRINLPLRVGKQIIGALNLMWRAPEGYANVNAPLLAQVAEAIALTLEKNRLLNETRQRDAILKALAYAGERLLMPGHLGEVLPDVLARLAKAAQLSRAYIFENQITAENIQLTGLRYEWIAPGHARFFADPAESVLAYQTRGLGRWAQRLMLGETLAGLARDFEPEERAFLEAHHVQSVALTPIFSGGVWWGFLGFDDDEQARAWWPAELEAFKNTADALGAAFARQRSENAEREERALAEALRDTLAALNSTLNFDEVLKRILDNAGRVVPHDAATVMLLKSRVARIVRAEAYTDHRLEENWAALRLPLEQSPHLRRILETGRSVAVADTETFAGWAPPPEAPWTRSYAGTPIKQKGRLIGFINLYSATPGFFTTSRVERLRAFTDQAGVALENAQFYEELERRVEERTRALAEANEQLKQLDKLKDQFISNVSHELRTPLTNIKLHLGLLDKRGPEALGRHLPTLQRETERLRGLIEDLLNLARLQTRALPPQREPYLIDDLLAEVVAVHTARAEAKGLILRHELNPTLSEVPLDRAEMMQVFNNLLGNAVAYTARGGHITLNTRAAKLGARQGVAIRFNNQAVIPSDDQQHLFERFYRGRTGRESGEPGTGLGLAICKEIVERHSGRIDVDSNPADGTTFTLWVPLIGG